MLSITKNLAVPGLTIKKKQLKFIFITLVTIYLPVFGQMTKADYYNKIDNKIFVLSKNKNLPFDSIVTNVMRSYPKNEDQVRAYYTWIALNITYDTERLRTLQENRWSYMRKDSSQEADPVFRKKKAVCEGFSKLMIKFCEASNIPCHMVIGYTKMPDGEIMTDILHAWNAVKIDDTWRLLDVTWSNGYVGLYGTYYRHFSDKYFIENTANFYEDHLPLDPQWQLSDKPISKNYFFRTDTLNKYFVGAAFSFNDSISLYKKQSPDNQAWLDYIHYYNYDPENKKHLNNADFIIYDKAVEILNDGILGFQEYQIFYSETLSKSKTLSNCKKAKTLLETSRNKYTEVLNFLEGRKAFSSEANDNLIEMRTNARNALVVIKDHMEYISRLQKSVTASKGKN